MRDRLLASYIAILLIMLILIGGVLLLFLRSVPLPTDEIASDLTGTLLEIRVLDVIQDNSLRSIEQRTIVFLESESDTRDVRMLVVTSEGEVHFDSDRVFEEGDMIRETDHDRLFFAESPRLGAVYNGTFINADGSQWVYVAQPLRPYMPARRDALYLVAAAPVPHPSLREVFRLFGDTFFRPLLQAGLIGLMVAIGLSVLITRSVARPLQQMSRAVRRIADGDLQQRVPVDGPHEVRALAQSFNEMAGRVSANQQAQRDFLANVSHDLRTPLTSIQGFSQAIVDGVASDPEAAQHAAQVIHDEAARMHRLVEGLLDLARIEQGDLQMKDRAVQVDAVLRAVSESLSVKAQEKGLALDIEIAPDMPRIAGDGDRLAQVFTNLIDNAIKYTPAGGRVSLCAQTNDSSIVVTVRDTGEGIPAADLPRIFERFYQVDKSRQRDRRHAGVGLGLAITHQIVEAHGGAIRVASKVGEGTVFTVWLPMAASDAQTLSLHKR
ncbi:MAG: HAMP domain-containing protein [Anaerolineae bacterium]|nr:HAMP domain-containing protein [Anaerolineae bacterium]